jgi:hypothetical protein
MLSPFQVYQTESTRVAESQREFLLSSIGLGVLDVALVKAALSVLRGRLQSTWVYSSVADADAVLTTDTALHSPDIVRLIDSRLRILLRQPGRTSKLVNELSMDAPINSFKLLTVLELASSRLLSQQQQRTRSDVVLDLGNELIDLFVDRAARHVRVTIKEVGTLTISFPDQKYAIDFPHSHLAAVLREPKFRLEVLKDSGSPKLTSSKLRPLSDLLWTAANLRGRKFQITDDSVALRLTRWPDFPQLKHDVEDLKFCEILSRGTMTPSQLQAASGMSHSRTMSFVTACALCGYLQTSLPHSDPSPAPITPRVQTGGLLERFRKRFGF